MELLIVLLVVVAIATPQEMKTMEDVEKELDFLSSKMASVEKAKNDTEDRLASVEKAKNDTEERLAYLEEISKLNVIRTCDEMSQFGITASNYYFVDPDGPLIGSDPFRVFCNFTEDGLAVTEVIHDSEELIEIGHCEEPGCYGHKIIYSAPEEQIRSLIQLSHQCEQTVRYDCLLAPLMANEINFAFWIDRAGEKNVYWHGSHRGEHVCSCFYEADGCIDSATKKTRCNCDADAPELVQDVGSITNKSALPLVELRYGGLHYEMQQAFHSVGRLRCWGTPKFEEGTSCAAMKRSGQYRSGFFNVRKNETSNSRVVFCNQTATPGYEDNGDGEQFINSSEDHIEMVEKNVEEIRSDVSANGGKISTLENDVSVNGGKISTLENDVSVNGGKISSLENDVASLEKKSSFCGSHLDWYGNKNGKVITYESLLVDDNNIPGASFSISSGQFTAGLSGVYNIQFSIGYMDRSGSDTSTEIYLRRNGINIDQSQMRQSTPDGNHDMGGGRSMLMRMEKGDTLEAYGRYISDVWYITFCVSLTK